MKSNPSKYIVKSVCGLIMALLLVYVPVIHAQTQTVTGTVTDLETRETLPGVNVVVKGTTIGTATNQNGEFSLNVPSLSDTLVISYLGFQTLQIPLDGRTTLSVGMAGQVFSGDELIVIGYGTVTRRDLTGSVTSLDPAILSQVPATNVMESLQGKVPGLDITRATGEAGSGVNLTLRGTRSLTASNNPLIIVDGVQYSNIQDINPADISSIDVLKDASSTAIYGSRGANGVILITTKQGPRTSGTRVSINTYTGISQVASYPAFNTGPEYVAQKREANRTTGTWSSPADDPLIFSADEISNIQSGVWTDFRDLLVKDGFQQEHQIGISTGSENTRVYLSLNYFNESGLFEKDNLDRYSTRLNVEQQVSSALRVGMQSQFTYYDRDRQRDPTNMANKINPLTAAYDADGDLIVRPHGGRDINPLADLEPNAYENNTLTTRFFPTFYAEFMPIDNLSLRSNLSANLTNSRLGIFRASNTIDRDGAAPEAIYESSNSRSVTFENIANYRTEIDRHSLGLTGVVSYQFGKNDFGSAAGTNQLLPAQLYFGLINAPDGRAINSGYSESSLMSYAARANYGWDSKYLFTVTGRFDGSSKLSKGNQWAFFPSAAFAWRMIDEGFMGEDGWIFSDLKLRVSYGVSGNDAIDPYSTQSSLRRVPFSFGENAAPGFTYSPTVGNADLQWELSHTANLGLDVGFWNNRIYASIDVYNTETSNLLLDRFLPLTSGVTSVTQNIGETRNRGIEIALSSKNVVTNELFWQTDLTFFSNKEEIVSLVGDGDDIANGWFIGQPTSVFFDYDMIGIWQLNEADQAAVYGQQPGDIRVRDVNGDGTISSTDDRVILGSPRPKWSGGIENSVRYRNFDFNIFVYARIGQMINYEYNRSYKPNGVENGARVNYWTPENPSNDFPRPDASRAAANYQFYSSMAYEDGSFVKIRNATIGYTLPTALAERFSMRRLRVYVTGRNLHTFSKIKDYDPERGGGLSFPMTRVLVTGFNLDF